MPFHWIERIFLRLLVVWGLFGMVSGAALVWPAWGVAEPKPGEAFAAAMGVQFFIWGAIDAALAGFGLRGIAKRELKPGPDADERARREKAVRFVRLNTKLDVGYVLIGVGLLVWAAFAATANGRAVLLGHGAGVIVQGGFLLLFDYLFARRLAAAVDSPQDGPASNASQPSTASRNAVGGA
jgi:hypothetical protein